MAAQTAETEQGSQTSPAAGQQKLITPIFGITWLANFAQYLVFYFLVTTMALYAVQRFAASDAASGFASSAFVLGATVARLFAGFLVDAYGRRKMLTIAVIVVVVSCATYFIPGSFTVLITARIVHGIGYGIASTAIMTIAQSIIPDARRAEGTGYIALGSTLATAIGPAMGLFFVNSFTYNTLFVATLLTAVIGLVLGLVLCAHPSQRNNGIPPKKRVSHHLTFAEIINPAVVNIGIFMLLVGTAYSGIITFLLPYSDERALQTGAGVFFFAYAAAMLISRLFLGRIQDRHGDNKVMYFAMICFVVALLLLAVANENWMVIVSGVLAGLGYGTLMPASQAIAARLTPAESLGSGISTLLLLTDVGVALGPVILGGLVSATSYATMYVVLAIVVVVAAIWYLSTHARSETAKHGVSAA